MKKIAAVALVVLFLAVGVAAAADTVGKIQSIDPMGKQVVLDDGTRLVCDDSTQIMIEGKAGRLEDLKEGSKVKAGYEEKNGQNVATMLEVTE